MAVSKRLRFEIFRRDNHACRYCGKTALDNELTVDHVTPSALGGSDAPENLVTACRDCNVGKSASSADSALVADVAADALRWSLAIKEAARTQAIELDALKTFINDVQLTWEDYERQIGAQHPLPYDWETTVEHWFRRGMSLEELQYAIRRGATKYGVKPQNVWRYACSIIWNCLNERQEIARKAVDAPSPVVDDEYEADQTDELLEREMDAVYETRWLTFAALMGSPAWDLQREVYRVCSTHVLKWGGAGTGGASHHAWFGDDSFQEFADEGYPSVKQLVEQLCDEWSDYMDDEDRKTVTTYIARLAGRIWDAVADR